MTPFKHIDVSEAKPGLSVSADGGFSCLEGGVVVTIAADDNGEMYVPCACGRHYLDGQKRGADEGYGTEVYVGLQAAA